MGLDKDILWWKVKKKKVLSCMLVGGFKSLHFGAVCYHSWGVLNDLNHQDCCYWGQRQGATVFRVWNTGLVTCVHLILMLLKEPQTPTLKMWREKLIENSACEMMLRILNGRNEVVTEQWDSLHSYVYNVVTLNYFMDWSILWCIY